MAEVINDIFGGKYFTGLFFSRDLAADVLVLAATLAIASLFIYKFYKSVSKRNVIRLNLRKYNTYEHPLASKLFAMILYLLEYLVVMPILIILWFAGLSIVLLVIAKERLPGDILLISAAIIGAIRILAYVRGEIAKDLAKLFPFITLSVFLLSPGEFTFELVLAKIRTIPLLLSDILSFVLVVVVIEIVLRVIYTIYDFWRSEGGREEAVAEVLKEEQQKAEQAVKG